LSAAESSKHGARQHVSTWFNISKQFCFTFSGNEEMMIVTVISYAEGFNFISNVTLIPWSWGKKVLFTVPNQPTHPPPVSQRVPKRSFAIFLF